MGLKIKWNDDRVRTTTTALLLICRDRLGRGATDDLIQSALKSYRDDPVGFKLSKAVWADVNESGMLRNADHAVYYQKLVSTVDRLVNKMIQGKRQFNSLAELDNFLVFSLKNVR